MARNRRTSQPAFSMFAFQDIITSVTGICILLTLVLVLHWINSPAKANAPREFKRAAITELEGRIAAARTELTAANDILERINREYAEAIHASPTDIRREMALLDIRRKKLASERETLAHQQAEVELQLGTSRAMQLQARESLKALHAAGEAQELRAKVEQLRKENFLIYTAEARATRLAWIVEISGSRVHAQLVDNSKRPALFRDKDTDALLAKVLEWARTRDPRREYFMLLVRPSGVEAYERLVPNLVADGFRYGFDLIDEAAQIKIEAPQGATR